MAGHQELISTRSTALLQQVEGGMLGGYRSCLFSGHDTSPALLTLSPSSVYHFHSQFATLVFLLNIHLVDLCRRFLFKGQADSSKLRQINLTPILAENFPFL